MKAIVIADGIVVETPTDIFQWYMQKREVWKAKFDFLDHGSVSVKMEFEDETSHTMFVNPDDANNILHILRYDSRYEFPDDDTITAIRTKR